MFWINKIKIKRFSDLLSRLSESFILHVRALPRYKNGLRCFIVPFCEPPRMRSVEIRCPCRRRRIRRTDENGKNIVFAKRKTPKFGQIKHFGNLFCRLQMEAQILCVWAKMQFSEGDVEIFD